MECKGSAAHDVVLSSEAELASLQETASAALAAATSAAAAVRVQQRRVAEAQAHLRSEETLAASALPLPYELIVKIFSFLGAEDKLRCCRVSRGFSSLLEARALWTSLELSSSSVSEPCPQLLRAASARAGGLLTELSVSGWTGLSFDVLKAVVEANAGALRTVRARGCTFTFDDEEGGEGTDAPRLLDYLEAAELLDAAPQLSLFELDLSTAMSDLTWLDADDEHMKRLSLGLLSISCAAGDDPLDVEALKTFLPDLKLNALSLSGATLATADVMEPLVDLAISMRLRRLHLLDGCSLSQRASLPPLARLLREGQLEELHIDQLDDNIEPSFSGAALPAFALALRSSRLERLHLSAVELWETLGDGLTLLGACVGHLTLRELNISRNACDAAHGGPIVGALLGAMLSTPSRLETLAFADCGLGDEALKPVFAALGTSSATLRYLHCSNNGVSRQLARSCILPAVRANRSLTSFVCYEKGNGGRSLGRAELVVWERGRKGTLAPLWDSHDAAEEVAPWLVMGDAEMEDDE